jgi:hypothetical protein
LEKHLTSQKVNDVKLFFHSLQAFATFPIQFFVLKFANLGLESKLKLGPIFCVEQILYEVTVK